MSNAIDAIDAEIEALDEVLKLEHRKLELLKTVRREALQTQSISPSPANEPTRASTPVSTAPSLLVPTSVPAPIEKSRPRPANKKKKEIKKSEVKQEIAYLPKEEIYTKTIEINNDYAMNLVRILSVKSQKMNSKGKKTGFEG